MMTFQFRYVLLFHLIYLPFWTLFYHFLHLDAIALLENFNPNTIEDETVREVVLYLMNLVENLSAKVQEQAEEIQRLRDENNRLKGEQGKPNIKPNTKANASLSSEKERRESKPHHKVNKQANIRIDRIEVVKVDEEHVPADAQGKRL